MKATIDWTAFARKSPVVDLAQTLTRNSPISPSHPPFQMVPLRRHGDRVRADGGSAANEVIHISGHAGTHIDALGHVSYDGTVYGGMSVAEISSAEGLADLDVMSLGCVVARGALLDVSGALAREPLDPGYEISVADLEETVEQCQVVIRPGDAVLIRTGWGALWGEPERYIGDETGFPGLGLPAASWLADRGAALLGGDTLTVEVRHPSGYEDPLPVHTELLVERGIPIIENMNLEELAQMRLHDFLFVALPLPLPGASGSPVRPIALVND